jgi:hypothetical protein
MVSLSRELTIDFSAPDRFCEAARTPLCIPQLARRRALSYEGAMVLPLLAASGPLRVR